MNMRFSMVFGSRTSVRMPRRAALSGCGKPMLNAIRGADALAEVGTEFLLLGGHVLDVVLRIDLHQQALRVNSGSRGLARRRYRDGLLPGADAPLLHVRLALPKHSDLDPVIHRRLGLG